MYFKGGSMEISETERSPYSTIVNDHEPRSSDTSFVFLLNLGSERLLNMRKWMAKIHDNVVSSNSHNEVFEAFKDDDIFSVML